MLEEEKQIEPVLYNLLDASNIWNFPLLMLSNGLTKYLR